MKPLAFIRFAGISGTLLFAFTLSTPALEPNDLLPGMSKAAAVSVYTGHRACGNFEFREDPQSIGWDASLYGRQASIKVQFRNESATSVLIVLFLEAGADGSRLFESLVQERIRDLGTPRPSSFLAGSRNPGTPRPASPGSSNPGSSNPSSASPDSNWTDTVVWAQDDHLVVLKRWPVTPAGEIHITRNLPR